MAEQAVHVYLQINCQVTRVWCVAGSGKRTNVSQVHTSVLGFVSCIAIGLA